MKLSTFTLQSCSDGKEISYCFANLNLLLFRCSLLLPSLKLSNNLILGNLNGVLIFSEFLAIKMAPIQGFQKGPAAGEIHQLFHVNSLPTFLWKLPQFFKIT